MRTTFIKAVTEAAGRDRRVVMLTGDLGYKLFDEFQSRFGDRFFNMGVSEANMVDTAVGLALEGFIPFTYSIVPFATMRCLEQLRNACCMNLPVTAVGVGGGFSYGHNGPTHHGIDELGGLRSIPAMTVVSPSDPRETISAVSALLASPRPAYLRLGRDREPVLPGTDAPFTLGRPTILRSGAEVAILACGPVAAEALKAAELGAPAANPMVLSVHTLKPLRGLAEILKPAGIRRLVTVEEHTGNGGLREAVLSALNEDGYQARVKGLFAPDYFECRAFSQQAMRVELGLDSSAILRAVTELQGE
jgi:transketolase